MTREEWLDIARRCEKATGPDREVDARITLAIKPFLGSAPYMQPEIGKWVRFDGRPDVIKADAYTDSIDAITALIRSKLPDWAMDADLGTPFSSDGILGARLFMPDGFEEVEAPNWRKEPNWRFAAEGNATTPALALCAAFARAMADKALSRNAQEKDAGK